MRFPSFFIPLALAATASTQTVNIVAHQDDDLLFLNPDILNEIQSGRSIRTIYITAGDAGGDESYWTSREEGSRAAYAAMSGVDNTWTQSDAGISGFSIPLFTLDGNPSISLTFLRLPDGRDDGQGFGLGSLQQLWQGAVPSLTAFTGSSYSKDALVSVLRQLLDNYDHDRVNTQDFTHAYGEGDHSDHYSTGYFVREAIGNCGSAQTLTSYMGYPVESLQPNVADGALERKTSTFYTYAVHDNHVCSSSETCSNRVEETWLQRQYVVDRLDLSACDNQGGTSTTESIMRTETASLSTKNPVNSRPVIPQTVETNTPSSSAAVPSETATPSQLLFTGGSGSTVVLSGGVCIFVAIVSAIAML
ncbi:hypothetical protein BDV59DRAFT_210062 [Aspergillus ambiguus]|uniref:uncharacterized protein n=1 Tax=Aspergillus ambiguus TaxID=176160 RepID=UPI003CCCFA5A